MSKKLSPDDPRNPVPYTKAIVFAAKAVAAGTANDDQQKRFARWLITDLCGTYDQSYRPDDRSTCFAEGKRFVGLSVVKLVNMTGTALDNLKE